MGLELKPSKTRIAHTLYADKSEDGIAGFDFLGYNIRQFPASKYVCARDRYRTLSFNTFIIPSKDACKKHQARISDIIRKHKHSPQAQFILELNPVIRGWCNYYKFSDAQKRENNNRHRTL